MRDRIPLCGHFFCEYRDCSISTNKKSVIANTKNAFELRYMRWDYFCRSSNPPPEYLKSVTKIVDYIASSQYYKNERLMRSHGMDMDDFKNIILVQCVSFHGVSSFENNPKAKKAFVDYYVEKNKKKPSSGEIQKKDNYRLMDFLRQRISDFFTILKKEGKEQPGSNLAVTYKKDLSDFNEGELVDTSHPERYGWKKIKPIEYKALKEVLIESGGQPLVIGNTVYRVFDYSSYVDSMEEPSINGAMNLITTTENPEQVLIKKEGGGISFEGMQNRIDSIIRNGDPAQIKRQINKIVKNPKEYDLDKSTVLMLKSMVSDGILRSNI